MRGKKGFTLIELLVVVAILGILAALLLGATGAFRTVEPAKIKGWARSYMQEMYPNATDIRISVVPKDTDGDGYYSADIIFNDVEPGGFNGDERIVEKTLELECSRNGCKKKVAESTGRPIHYD